MEKGRFYKVMNGLGDRYFRLTTPGLNRLYIQAYRPAEHRPEGFIKYFDDEKANPTEITDFCNNICFEILKSHGFEYNRETDTVENVVYLWDANLIPGERFIGVSIVEMKGTENTWSDFFDNIEMSVDILSSYESDLGYNGLHCTYHLYLPYTEDNLKIYQKYTRHKIVKRNSGNFFSKLPKKIKM